MKNRSSLSGLLTSICHFSFVIGHFSLVICHLTENPCQVAKDFRLSSIGDTENVTGSPLHIGLWKV